MPMQKSVVVFFFCCYFADCSTVKLKIVKIKLRRQFNKLLLQIFFNNYSEFVYNKAHSLIQCP